MKRDESILSTLSVSGIEQPDWETFEQVEKYAMEDGLHLLRFLLPNRIWSRFFSPTELDAEEIRHQRDRITEAYESVHAVYQEAKNQLDHGCRLDGKSGGCESAIEFLDDPELHHYPTLADPQGHHNSLSSYLTAIEQAISREEDVLHLIDRLLTDPVTAFLRDEERSELRDAQKLFSNSVERGNARKERLEQERQEFIESLGGRIGPWKRELERLEKHAQPYLELDKYLVEEEELLNETESLVDEIATTLESGLLVEIVCHPVVDRSSELEQRASGLLERLEHSPYRYAECRLAELESATQISLSDIRRRLKPAREAGEEIESPESLTSSINDLRSSIEQFRNEPYRSHLLDPQLAELSQYESELAECEIFIQEKTWFDSEFEEISGDFDKIRVTVEPYLTYSRYLTRPVSSELSARLDELQLDLEDIAEEAQFSTLSESDQQRVRNLEAKVRSIESHLTDYNAKFVRRQQEECAELFTDVGSSDNSLTSEQEQAVIRDGIYNQVVAAAGTGKTLTLTTRVAYLIQDQGIDPDRILVVTYTKEATEEMRTRLEEHFDITDVETQTVHAFGRGIIRDANDDQVESIDPNQIENLIDREIRRERGKTDSAFLDHYYGFLVHFDDVYYEEKNFETKKEYVQSRATQAYTTLKGEEVRSRAEKLIADFLFTHRVDYRYEDIATWADTAPDKGKYAPDFYLPEYRTYIEHWGIDESASVAPWFSWSSEEYCDKIRWARGEFEKNEFDLIETYEFEHEAGRVGEALAYRLSALGIELDRMGFEELIETAFDYEQREGWIKSQFKTFIENARLFDLKPEEIEPNLSTSNPRQYHFGQCGIHLIQQYVRYLVENDLIDYTDMIHDAVDLVQQRPRVYEGRWDHILVDEFQDIGKGKLELVQALTGPSAAKLFSVGDDWQSVFSFQGAVVEYFTAFEEYFGEPVRTDLTENFRSPPRVVEAGNHLIENNDDQLQKQVRAVVDRNTAPRVHTLRGYNFSDYVRRVRRYTLELVQQYLAEGSSPSDVMILCRYDGAVPYLDEIKEGLRSQEIPYIGKSDRYRGPHGRADDGVTVYSLYQAKGREAKHVIVVHVTEGPYGFPPADRENELVEPVQPFSLGGIEEERRAFYVAITRTEETLDLLTRAEHESRFLDEISEFTDAVDAGKVEPLDEVGENMFVTVKVDKLHEPWTKQHQRGFLADRYGGSARFVSWKSNDPPTLEEDEWYELSGVRVGEYKDEKELVLTPKCSITHLSDGSHDPDIPEAP